MKIIEKNWNITKKTGIAAIPLLLVAAGIALMAVKSVPSIKKTQIPQEQWQAKVRFPDWLGETDNSLAVNSMYSFTGFRNNPRLYVTVSEDTESFSMFLNNKQINTKKMRGGNSYSVDAPAFFKNGTNTIQVGGIVPDTVKNGITITVPHPVVTVNRGSKKINPRVFSLIDKIISSDVRHGFPGAQLVVIKDGEIVYKNSWGYKSNFEMDGTPLTHREKITDETLFDVASVTKVFSAVYGLQYLMDQGLVTFDDKVSDILGYEFHENTLEIKFSEFGEDYPGIEEIKRWKSQLTIQDFLCHRAGFPPLGRYSMEKFDQEKQELSDEVDNVLYIPSPRDKKKTFDAICRTPLIYQPRTKTKYSDLDFMILGLVIEKISGKNLNEFLSEVYWKPLELRHITFNPTKNGFKKTDCAATELNGNTRDGIFEYDGIRKYTLQGEVHDEGCFECMEGESGHAGLFSNAENLAKLASVMLTGGYGTKRFFSKTIRDLFISPNWQSEGKFGSGWMREGDMRRTWHYGTQSSSFSFGHQGWTKCIVTIDPTENLIVAMLTNSKNSPITYKDNLPQCNVFDGDWYTTPTLGFVQQIIYMGMEPNQSNLEQCLKILLDDMVKAKKRLVDETENLTDDHAIWKAYRAISEVSENKF